MHLLLTDLLTCPRCGPDFGLILLSDELRDRRVRAGSVGCANCRSIFPVTGGVADLRHPSSPPLVAGGTPRDDPDRALRVAALLGVQGANSTVLVLEAGGGLPTGVAALLPDVHVVAASPAAIPAPAEPLANGPAVTSRIVTGQRIPLRTGSLKGAAVVGMEIADLLPEIRRVLGPGAHLVVEPAGDDLAERLRKEGFIVHLEQDGVVVAGAPERR